MGRAHGSLRYRLTDRQRGFCIAANMKRRQIRHRMIISISAIIFTAVCRILRCRNFAEQEMVSFDDYGSGKFVPAGKRNPRGSASFSNRGSVDQYCNWNIKVVKRVKEHDKGMETFMHDPASQKIWSGQAVLRSDFISRDCCMTCRSIHRQNFWWDANIIRGQ